MSTSFEPRPLEQILKDCRTAVERWAMSEIEDKEGETYEQAEEAAQSLWRRCIDATDGFTDLEAVEGNQDLIDVVRYYIKGQPSRDQVKQLREEFGVSTVEALQQRLDDSLTFGDPYDPLVAARVTTRIADNLHGRMKRSNGYELEEKVAADLRAAGYLDLDQHWAELDGWQQMVRKEGLFRPEKPGTVAWPRFESVWNRARGSMFFPCQDAHPLCKERWKASTSARKKVVSGALQQGTFPMPAKSFTRQGTFKTYEYDEEAGKEKATTRTADMVVQPPATFEEVGLQLPPKRLVEAKRATDTRNVEGKRGNELAHQVQVLSQFGVPVLYMEGTFPETFLKRHHTNFQMVFSVSDPDVRLSVVGGQ